MTQLLEMQLQPSTGNKLIFHLIGKSLLYKTFHKRGCLLSVNCQKHLKWQIRFIHFFFFLFAEAESSTHTEKQNPKNIVEKECEDHLVPTPLPRTGTPITRPGYSKPHLALNISWNGASKDSLGSLYQCPHSKGFLPNMKEGKVITLISSLHALVRSPSPSFI